MKEVKTTYYLSRIKFYFYIILDFTIKEKKLWLFVHIQQNNLVNNIPIKFFLPNLLYSINKYKSYNIFDIHDAKFFYQMRLDPIIIYIGFKRSKIN